MPFSHREKIIKPETEPKVEGKDFAELEAVKRYLFERIKKEKANIDFVQRVMGHSIKDGIELANFVGFSNEDIIKVLFSKNVFFKHRSFLAGFEGYVYLHDHYLNEDNKDLFNEEIGLAHALNNNYDPEKEEKWQETSLEDSEMGELARDIDEYYSRFLSLRSFIQEDSLGKSRQIKIEKEKKTESQKVEEAERTGEKVLEWLQKSYEKNYETRLIKPIIWEQLISEGEFDVEILVKELTKAGVPNEDITQLVYTPLIDFKTLKIIADKIGLDLESTDTAKKLEKFRWKPYQVAVRGEIGHSKKILLNSLIDEVEAQTGGQKTLVLGEDGEYKIVENTSDREKREGGKEEIDFKNPKEDISILFDKVHSIQEISGKLTLDVEINGLYYIVHGGRDFGPYQITGKPQEISGKLTVEVKGNGQWFVMHGDKDFGPYEEIGKIQEILGKPTFRALKNGQVFVVYGDKEFGPYTHVDDRSLKEISGKLTFKIYKSDRQFIIYDGKEIGPYEDITNIEDVLGKLTFKKERNNKSFIIYGDQNLGPYADAFDVKEISDKLTFQFRENRKSFIKHGEKEFGPYDNIYYLVEINNKLTFVFQEKEEYFIQHGSEKLGPYDLGTQRADSVKEISGKLTFEFTENGKKLFNMVLKNLVLMTKLEIQKKYQVN